MYENKIKLNERRNIRWQIKQQIMKQEIYLSVRDVPRVDGGLFVIKILKNIKNCGIWNLIKK